MDAVTGGSKPYQLTSHEVQSKQTLRFGMLPVSTDSQVRHSPSSSSSGIASLKSLSSRVISSSTSPASSNSGAEPGASIVETKVRKESGYTSPDNRDSSIFNMHAAKKPENTDSVVVITSTPKHVVKSGLFAPVSSSNRIPISEGNNGQADWNSDDVLLGSTDNEGVTGAFNDFLNERIAVTPGTKHMFTPGRIKYAVSFTENDIASIKYGKRLGSGSFGVVHSVRHPRLNNGEPVALKVSDKQCQVRNVAETEVNTLSSLNHENIVRALAYHISEKIMLFMEQGEENLFNVLNKQLENSDQFKFKSLENKLMLSQGIANGIRYLHDQENLIHGDLKPANIILRKDLTPQIIDFGFSVRTQYRRSLRSEPACYYMPPEMTHHEKCLLDKTTDVFTFGMILLQIIACQNIPYAWMNEKALEGKAKKWYVKNFEKHFRSHPAVSSYSDMSLLKPLLIDMHSKEQLLSQCKSESEVETAVLMKLIDNVVMAAMQRDPGLRLSISDICNQLESKAANLLDGCSSKNRDSSEREASLTSSSDGEGGRSTTASSVSSTPVSRRKRSVTANDSRTQPLPAKRLKFVRP